MKITKDKVIFTIIISIIVIILSSVSTYATSYLFNSNEVSYNNNASGIESDNVQGAIDELYEEATTYAQLNNKINNMVKNIYPIGCYLETTDTSFNPNTAFEGTTWVLESEGLVHVSSGTNYAVSNNNQDGGEATHTLTVNEMPSHNHKYSSNNVTISTEANAATEHGITQAKFGTGSNQMWRLGTTVENTGGNGAHNNMQPYKIVNRWHRTA